MSVCKIIRRVLLGGASVFGLLLIAFVIAAVLGVSINAAPWRQPLAARASALIGRQVTVEGPLRLTIGVRPELIVGGITAANPPGFSSPQLARLGRAHMLMEFRPLLRNEINLAKPR